MVVNADPYRWFELYGGFESHTIRFCPKCNPSGEERIKLLTVKASKQTVNFISECRDIVMKLRKELADENPHYFSITNLNTDECVNEVARCKSAGKYDESARQRIKMMLDLEFKKAYLKYLKKNLEE